MQHKSDPTKQSWEDADFPILCQTCLGDNPYIRMTKEKYGKECKICTRPFTVFRWCPGKNARFKKTEVCQTCAKLKNVCQTCIFDLEYGLPVEVRDKAMGLEDNIPKAEVNREYYAQNQEALMAGGDPGQLALGDGRKADSALLQRFARTTPYYKRNRAHICSFWVKGECKRGEECPYRHEMPTDPNDPLAKQNIKDRYYGQNDPVAAKIFDKAKTMPKLEPPSDRSVMTLFVGGVTPDVKEQDLRDFFYQFGQLESIRIVERQACAFVTYASRADAEMAASRAFNNCMINGRRLRIMWGRSQAQQSGEAGQHGGVQLAPVPNLPMPGGMPAPPPPPPPHMMQYPGPPAGAPPPPPGMPPGPPRGPPPAGAIRPPGPPPGAPPRPRAPVHYPSQDPHRLGTNRQRD